MKWLTDQLANQTLIRINISPLTYQDDIAFCPFRKIATIQVMSDPPSYAVFVRSNSDAKKESLYNVAEAVGDYLEVNQSSIRDNVKKEIIHLAYTFAVIEDDFAKITPEIRKLDESKVLRQLRSKDWQDLHDVRCHVR